MSKEPKPKVKSKLDEFKEWLEKKNRKKSDANARKDKRKGKK